MVLLQFQGIMQTILPLPVVYSCGMSNTSHVYFSLTCIFLYMPHSKTMTIIITIIKPAGSFLESKHGGCTACRTFQGNLHRHTTVQRCSIVITRLKRIYPSSRSVGNYKHDLHGGSLVGKEKEGWPVQAVQVCSRQTRSYLLSSQGPWLQVVKDGETQHKCWLEVKGRRASCKCVFIVICNSAFHSST